MRRPGDSPLTRLSGQPAAQRPGRVAGLRGIIFQSDTSSLNGRLLIRPIEAFDRWQAGLLTRESGDAPLAMHAGLHVVLEDGREFVAEQLVGTLFEDFKDALNWTPLAAFHAREAAGWDVTVPATAFRGIDEAAVAEAIGFLNTVTGHGFFGEDCTTFIERAFGGRRLFGDSPTARALGFGLRVGDPALPLLRPDAQLDARDARLLRLETVQAQPDALAAHDAPNAHLWLGRIIVWSVLAAAGWMVAHWLRRRAAASKRRYIAG